MAEFPHNPINGAVHTIGNVIWQYKQSTDQWEVVQVIGWRIEQEPDNALVWLYNDEKKMKIDINGNLTVTGDITAFGILV